MYHTRVQWRGSRTRAFSRIMPASTSVSPCSGPFSCTARAFARTLPCSGHLLCAVHSHTWTGPRSPPAGFQRTADGARPRSRRARDHPRGKPVPLQHATEREPDVGASPVSRTAVPARHRTAPQGTALTKPPGHEMLPRRRPPPPRREGLTERAHGSAARGEQGTKGAETARGGKRGSGRGASRHPLGYRCARVAPLSPHPLPPPVAPRDGTGSAGRGEPQGAPPSRRPGRLQCYTSR